MTNRGARAVVLVAGIVAIVVGGVFAGQGAGLIPGSFMTGSRMWLEIGAIVVVVGIVLVVLGLRRRRSGRGRR